MNTIRRAKNLLASAAGLGVLLLVSANPALADHNRDRYAHGDRHYDRGHGGHHYGHGHHKRHHRKHLRHQRRHRLAMHHRYSDHRVGYDQGYRYPAQPYVTYQQPYQSSNYATGGSYSSGYHGSSPNFGNAVGGALGGYLGSQIGSGSGQLAATAAGAVLGYSLGGHLGADY